MVGLRFDLARQGWSISWCEQATYQQRYTPPTITSTVIGLDRRMDGNSFYSSTQWKPPYYTAPGRRISIASAPRTNEKAEQTSPDLGSLIIVSSLSCATPGLEPSTFVPISSCHDTGAAGVGSAIRVIESAQLWFHTRIVRFAQRRVEALLSHSLASVPK